jgi:hypothetical protein
LKKPTSGHVEVNPPGHRYPRHSLAVGSNDRYRKSAVASIKAGADQHAANVLPIIKEAQKAGATTLRAVAEALNARGISTARGGNWHAMSVKNVLDRQGARS